MKISTIIPLYNAKDTIVATINSVINQSYSESIEIIVVNDGSTDGCEKLVEKLISENDTNRIIKLINKPNGGVSSARNRGIKEASGKWIAFLDSDDVWHIQKLQIVLDILEANSIEILGHSYTLDNNINRRFQSKIPKEISFISLLIRNFAVTPSVVVKKDILEYFDESMRYTEDHELWLRLALKNKVYFVDLPLVRLARSQLAKGGLSSNKWLMRKGEIKMFVKIAKLKKWLTPFIPLLIFFSLLKHLRARLKSFL
ncbi:glycosyltransferase family 2 protein [Francisella sp. SYW-9]|uniref:glycosyltransferase family 2 protein n=1 Tax=Francisella sp. SYW-9 TaxID=2610888 RepID=UPI00123DFD7B|nr:glycosyltransferase [Francisella sp. SYW-9]